MSAATWPEGIIARYVTVGGGFVDLTHDLDPGSSDREMGTAASCTGCPATVFESRADYVSDGYTDRAAGAWAQAHAASCRAVPKPGVVS